MPPLSSSSGLARDLRLDGAAHAAQGVEVLGLRTRAERLARTRHGQVDIRADTALLHLAVGYARVTEYARQLLDKRHGLVRAVDVRLGHALDERHAAAVVVHRRDAPAVHQLARVLFEVYAVKTYRLFLAVHVYLHLAAHTERKVVLAGLPRLGAGRDRNSSCGPTWNNGLSCCRWAQPARTVYSTALRLSAA